MKDDLKIIKKKYGEKMMHLCRELFSTILDNKPGVLAQIMLETFEPSHDLYDDLTRYSLETKFKNYLYNIYTSLNSVQEPVKQTVEDPVTLLKKAGYTLYECQTESEIQAFRKYYAPGEELCTFTNGNRLYSCYVYFAVKDNVAEIDRNNFPQPQRQDEYGTSVISIQFTRDKSHTLSIKNRYNHTVNNPDATFANNLDNIIPGLTQSFAEHYGMRQTYFRSRTFEIPGYVRANDGKFYKYNYEINNVYYCPNNVIIANFQKNTYPKERFIIIDYFILDLVNKKIINNTDDSFPNTIGEIKNIEIKNENNQKVIRITQDDGKEIVILVDKFNRIISYENNHVTTIPNKFLTYNETLKNLSLESATMIGSDFLFSNIIIKKILLLQVKIIADNFMYNNNSLIEQIFLPQVKIIGNNFMGCNFYLRTLELPEVKMIGDGFLRSNNMLETILLSNVESIGHRFLERNTYLREFIAPKVIEIGDACLISNIYVNKIDLSNLKWLGSYFLTRTQELEEVVLPEVILIGSSFLSMNNSVTKLILPKVKTIDARILGMNNCLREFYAPKLTNELDNLLLNELHQDLCNNPKKLKKINN